LPKGLLGGLPKAGFDPKAGEEAKRERKVQIDKFQSGLKKG
jgi:hypothetical protein